MVLLSAVQSSNSCIKSQLPARLVGVFVGATSGIGETTLKQFARHVKQPCAYFVGRSQDAADRIIAECKKLNPDGTYIFIKADVSLIRNVDAVCKEIMAKESAINIMVLTQGTLDSQTETSEGLRFIMALGYYSRARFIVNLLPFMERAPAIRRVVSVFAAGYEGKIARDNLQGYGLSMFSYRNHVSALITMSHEAAARKAPTVSFVHEFPGMVNTPGFKDFPGLIGTAFRTAIRLAGSFICIPLVESGERHLFLATSAIYPPSENARGESEGSGVPFISDKPDNVTKGTNGELGSGVYSLRQEGESSGFGTLKVLDVYRKEGMVDTVWQHTENEFRRIAGETRAS